MSKRVLRRGWRTALAGLLIAASGTGFAQEGCPWSPATVRGPCNEVLVAGAVARPGVIALRDGLNVSSALSARGGTTRDAYTYGAILLRALGGQSTVRGGGHSPMRAGEREALLIALSGPHTDPYRAGILHLLTDPASRYTRLSASADPALQRRRPGSNVDLAPGDILFIPERPDHVTVIGTVKQPSVLSFDSGTFVEGYVSRAGGWARGAARSKTRAYLPDGSWRELSPAYWSYKAETVPPGTVIVVPHRRGDDAALRQTQLRDLLVAEAGEGAALRQPQQRDAAP